MTEYDGMIEEPRNEEQVEIDRRAQTTENTVMRIISGILRKPQSALTLYDKTFLKARASYLTDGQRREYEGVLEADYSKGNVSSVVQQTVASTLEDLTNEELRERLKRLKVSDDDIKQLKNKAQLVEALKIANDKQEQSKE